MNRRYIWNNLLALKSNEMSTLDLECASTNMGAPQEDEMDSMSAIYLGLQSS